MQAQLVWSAIRSAWQARTSSTRRLTHVQRVNNNGTVAVTNDYEANRAPTVHSRTAASRPPAVVSASGAVVDGRVRVLTNGAFQRVRFGATATASGTNSCAAALFRQPGTAKVRRWIYANALNPVAQLDERNRITQAYVYGNYAHTPDYLVTFSYADAESTSAGGGRL